MDISSIVGLVGGVSVIGYALLTSNGNFLDIASVIITIFGSLFATLLAVKGSSFRGLGKLIRIAFSSQKIDKNEIISRMVSLAEKSRREGILALEETLDEIEDPFLKKGLQMAVDGTDAEIIKPILYIEIDQIQERHAENSQVFHIWAEFAPAFGMIGTLIGLIEMMNNMGGDATVIGAGMAKALITTLYGSIMANMLLTPIKKKLDSKDKDELLCKEMIIEGIASIQGGDNPRMLETKLLAFLEPKMRKSQLNED